VGANRERRLNGRASRKARPRSRRCLTLRKDGQTYAFAYPPEHERAALAAFAGCPAAEAADVLALVCYLGHDPRTLDLDL
jgi:hypothetical protein